MDREPQEKHESRWAAFTEEEVRELRAGAIERHQRSAIPAEFREQAGVLAAELEREVRAREFVPSYRGPGIYLRWDGITERAHGTALIATSAGGRLVVLERPLSSTPHAEFTAVTLEYFDGRDDGRRRYSYVEGLQR